MNKKNLYLLLLLFGILFSQNRNDLDFDVLINDNPYPANIFIHSMGFQNYMTILDHSIQPYWQINSSNMGIDFKKNSSYLTYFEKNSNIWIKANNMMQEVDTMQCNTSIGYTDYHDIRLLDNGNYIMQSYDSLYIDMGDYIEGGQPNTKVKGILRIQEFDINDNLLLDWFAFEHLHIEDYTSSLNFDPVLFGSQITWMHGNSIEIDYDDNLIISNRRSSEVLKIHRTSGEIIWIMGGPLNEFEIIDDNLNGFSKQHDVRRLENGNILVFDNGNQHNPPLSRIVEYQVDEVNKTATLVWEYINPDGDVSMSMGSAQRLPNQNTLINWGNMGGMGSNIVEVDYDQNIVLQLSFPGHNTYKVRKNDWQFEIPMQLADSNLDNTINVLDVLYIVNYVLYNNTPNNIFNLYKIDLNRDNIINVVDIVEMVNIILS